MADRCSSSTTTSSRAASARSRRATSASSRSTSSPATAESARTSPRTSPGSPGASSTRWASSSGLTELEKGAVNVVVQPGQWPTPRVDHLGFVLEEDQFEAVLERAAENGLRVQEHGGRRTFISTNAGYRLELHPPREWIDELLAQGGELELSELHLKADDPSGKAKALAEILDADRDGQRRGRRRRRPLRQRGPTGPARAVRRAVRLATAIDSAA